MGAAAMLLASSPVRAAGPDDDLAVVRRAVRSSGPVEAPAAAAKPARQAPRAERRAAKSEGPGWLKVRIADEDGDGGSLSLNLPLGLIAAIGDACQDEDAGDDRGLRLSDLLEGLERGQSLVSIEGDDAHIRVWVE